LPTIFLGYNREFRLAFASLVITTP